MLPLKILTQPNDSTCGPTSLHAVYDYYGHAVPLDKLIGEVEFLNGGGTLAVLLGVHALENGFKASLYSYNLRIFDPSWHKLSMVQLSEKLQLQRKQRRGVKLREATDAYLEFIRKGGIIKFNDLTPKLIKDYLISKRPILTGLSATYLYKSARESVDEKDLLYDNDISGDPTGHFVVLAGWDKAKRNVLVADPFIENPINGTNYYPVNINRLINSILLGIITYDANILIIAPKA
ncbi:MAG: hypothetical protein ACJATA_001316 [Sphingobacteriales bacterium]|jgi:hypothetical protein